ncbi:HD-GYP domain-containing protein [Cohnella soli]|uniref:HD-GYP domain-containing protein n=1 Tax=Cohnella soli TaxID=425005 RepID=A0ABW0HMB8_9BACL
MRMVPIAASQPGMRLAKKIYSDDGIVLLAEGVELNAKLIRRLGECGINYLYIQDDITSDVVVRELISEETQRSVLRAVKTAFKGFMDPQGRGRGVTYPYVGKNMRQAMHLILDDLSRNQDAMIMLMNMQTVDNYLYRHSLNVCVYTALLGMAYGYDDEQMVTLGMGALLHDVGKTQISLKVLLKPDKLSDFEYEEMKRHTERGYYLLKDEPNIPLLAAHCAFQHHERLDGSGYPRGIKGNEIHEFAKWIGIVDSYDAMTSHRIYRTPILPHQAVEALYSGSGTLYETSMLRLFRDKVAIYPIGMSLKLNTGQTAVVTDINSTCAHRPVIRVLTDEYGRNLNAPYDMDLSKHLNVLVSQVAFGQEELSPLTV